MLACVVRACKSRREGGGRCTRGERAAKAARRRQVFDNVQHVFVQISSNELVDFIKLFFFKTKSLTISTQRVLVLVKIGLTYDQ